MYSMHADADDIRSYRKSSLPHSFMGRSLLTLTVLWLFAAQVSCRSADPGFGDFAADDVDKIELHQLQTADGVLSDVHPVIFYKEDIVSEDYDPSDVGKQKKISNPRLRKYKEISRRHRYNATLNEQYRALKPEKIYFDVLPQAPVVLADDSSATDSKFDPSRIRVEILSLAEDDAANGDEDAQSKQILSKRPKKYRRRQRRDTSGEFHKVQKRAPSYLETDFNRLLSIFQGLEASNQPSSVVRHPVKGIYYNTISPPGPQREKPETVDFKNRFGDENETDRVIWGSKPSGRVTTRRPLPPLFHNSNPENWDTSFMNPTRQPATTQPRQPATTRRPLPPLFHNSNPENWDTSFLSPQSTGSGSRVDTAVAQTEQTATTEKPQVVSQCVWAIVSCCSRQNLNIRNDCFEAMNCGRHFWGLNPCSEDILDKAVLHVDKFLD